MITPLSPLVKRKSFPQKLVELVENYVKKGMKQMPWEPWMADTIEKLEPIYENLK